MHSIANYDVNVYQQAPEFQQALLQHNVGDIFKVDVPNSNTNYLVVINAQPTTTRAVSVRHLVYE